MTLPTPPLDHLQKENRFFLPPMAIQENGINLQQYAQLYKQSLAESDRFWLAQAESLVWQSFPKKGCEWSWDKEDVWHTWFADGILNVTESCLDCHIEQNGGKKALIWQGEDDSKTYSMSYKELLEKVCCLANALKKLGITKGDRVAIYLPMIPEAIISMLACARIGAIHTVVFAGFSAEALAYRLNDTESRLLITAHSATRGGKEIPLGQIAQEALSKNDTVEHTIIVGNSLLEGITSHRYEELVRSCEPFCKAEPMNAEDPLFILYTSGSTGKPKGIVHSQAGYLLYASLTHKHIFNLQPNDIYWCTADVGWVTGHSYIVYGPLANNTTILLYEGTPTYPDPGRFWHVVDKHQVTILYTAPTVIRTLMHHGNSYPASYDLSSLRLLGSVGEPINPEVWIWFFEHIGKKRCPIVDTWWQTETGGIMISPIPSCHKMKPGSASKPFFGVEPVIVREDGSPCKSDEGGSLCIKRPWPGIMRSIWGDQERFMSYFTAFPGKYFSGDGARCDEESDFWFFGRIDDVINVSGHRFGTAEIESALISHEAVAEAAVVPIEHEIKGQALFAYAILLEGVEESFELIASLKQHVRKEIGAIAIPDEICIVKALPKTRSGKIMRRILRKIAEKQTDDLGDISTLADEQVIVMLIAKGGAQ
jgi:acetyl-CoA synthetase